MKLSVIIPTFNPRMDYLQAVLDALRGQTLPPTDWELVIVDNRSEPPLADRVDLRWHPHARVVREEQTGLTRARLRGFRETTGELVVLVDDDNVLDADYLAQAVNLAQEFPRLGTWSGRLTLKYENPALAPPPELAAFLTLREFSTDIWSNDIHHHASTPWGAGLCIRRTVCDAYQRRLAAQAARLELDLQGNTLVYGGDTDIAYTGCGMGLGKGVFTRLHITHLIPKRRCDRAFLRRAIEGQGYSEILHGWLNDGVVRNPRRDLTGRIGEWIRRFRMSAVRREVFDTLQRGRLKAFRELSQKQTTAPK